MKRFATAAMLMLAVPASFAATSNILSLVPTDAVSVGVVHLGEMRSSPLSSMLFEQTDKISTDGDAQRFLRDAGLSPSKDIDVLVVSTSPVTSLNSEPEVLVSAEGRFNVEKLSAALVTRGAVQKGGYYLLPRSAREGDDRDGAVAFPDAHLALMGSQTAVVEALKARANGGTSFVASSGLARDIARISPNATAWALIDVPRAQRLAGGNFGRHSSQNPGLTVAMKTMSIVALWAKDNGNSLELGAFGVSHDADTLQLIEDTVRGALSAMRLAVQDKSPEIVSLLRKFSVGRGDDSVTLSGTLPAEAIRSFMAKSHT